MHLFQEESLTFMEHFHYTKSFFIVGKVSLYFKKKIFTQRKQQNCRSSHWKRSV